MPTDGRKGATYPPSEAAEGRDAGFDCLIDLVQTVRQGVTGEFWGRRSIDGG